MNIKEVKKSNKSYMCQCNNYCYPNSSKWCNTIVYDIYKNDNLNELPESIINQMILALKDKIKK